MNAAAYPKRNELFELVHLLVSTDGELTGKISYGY